LGVLKWDLDTQHELDLSAIDKMINTTQFVKHINFFFIAFNPKIIIHLDQITSYFLNEKKIVVKSNSQYFIHMIYFHVHKNSLA
jgi:hypothetical protein